MTFPMAWKTARRPADSASVVNGRILVPVADDLASRVGRMQAAPADVLPPAPATAQAAYSAPEMAQPLYQAAGRDRFSGYLQNPLDSLGRQRMLEQFIEAPLGGHVRRLLGDSQVAEQAAAGVLATGVGSWGLLSAIDALNGDSQTPGTMPIV